MLLDLENRIFFISRDMVFYEDMFPFHTAEGTSESFFLDISPVPRHDFTMKSIVVDNSVATNHHDTSNVP